MAKTATSQKPLVPVIASAAANDSEDFYASLIAQFSTDSIVIMDPLGKVVWANAAFEEQTGFKVKDVLGQAIGKMTTGPETDPETLERVRLALTEQRSERVEIIQYNKKKDPVWIELNLSPVFDETGKMTHFLSSSHLITDRKALEAEREEALVRERQRKAERHILAKTTEWLYSARTLTDLYAIVEKCIPKLIPNANGGLYIYSNSRDVLDIAVKFGTLDVPSYIEPDNCWALRRGRSYHYGQDEIEFPCGHVSEETDRSFCLPLIAHGETIGMLTFQWEGEFQLESTDDKDGDVERVWDLALMLAEQISLTIANVRLRQELQDRSIKDPLTELWNRRYFLETLRKAKSRCDDRGEIFSLISIDIDHFKLFNDHHGHDAGDLVLRHVGDAMKTHAGETCTPCRIGGEEFAIICPGMSGQEALEYADQLRERVKDIEVKYQGQKLPQIAISAGISTYPTDAATCEVLTKLADEALYDAKNKGRDRVILASSS
ncbi:MAG: hypothetical protein Hens3KO_07600 [Henriciella sp.]